MTSGRQLGKSGAKKRSGKSPAGSMFTDKDGHRTVGFCVWCDSDFYSLAEVKAHNAKNMKACPIFQKLKPYNCMPPVLQVMLESIDRRQKDRKKSKKGRKSREK
jgi:hypothetical protein